MTILEKYARLLVHYCLDLKQGEKAYIKTTILAEPLVREIFREAIKIGAHIEINWEFREQQRIFYLHADHNQLQYIPTSYANAIEHFDAYLFIRAPYNLKENQNIDPEKTKTRQQALKHLSSIYTERTADKSLRRSLCQYPTQASAQEAGMSLEEYQTFVFKACNLYHEDPQAEWLKVRKEQQRIVDYLNTVNQVTYQNDKFEISFSVKDRIWINSDGRTNMPSGEVFTGPIEDSINGEIYFDYPSIYQGQELRGIRLVVENGEVKSWTADQGQKVLDQVFEIEGARYFGEVAIGTNYQIQRATKNILFDEKIGGSIHMAIGQSYKETGGTNNSPIHLDMITSMTTNASIIADNKIIYLNGKFLI